MGEEELRDLVRFIARREGRDRRRAWASRLQERGGGSKPKLRVGAE